MSDSYTLTEVAKHNNPESLFVVIDNGVYDVTSMFFQSSDTSLERLVRCEQLG